MVAIAIGASHELFEGKGHGSSLGFFAADLDSSFKQSGIDS